MKYLVSLYFDDKTNQQILRHMVAVAEATGNDYMLEHKVPPHITISSFEVDAEANSDIVGQLVKAFGEVFQNASAGVVQWVGTGAFMTSTLYLSPVLNQYLQNLMEDVYDVVSADKDIKISKYYQPFQWLPHTTIGKKLGAVQLVKAFDVVQPDFKVITGNVIKIGLAKASPYEDIVTWNCEE